MKSALVAALAAGVAAASFGTAGEAQAGDFHGGVFAGYASGETTDWTYLPGPGPDVGDFDTDGGLFGVYAGFGKTLSNNVYVGVEADYAAAEIEGDNLCPNPTWTCSTEIDSLISLRARVGRDTGAWMFYGTAGVVWGDVTTQTDDGTGPYGESKFRNGWAAGVGVERDIGTNMALRLEYLHYDLGGGSTEVDFGDLVDTDIVGDSIRLGLHWRFSRP